jgi:hypothetical protein
MATTASRIRVPRPAGRATPRPIAGRGRDAARVAFAGFFFAMAAVNATVTLPNTTEFYKGFAELSWPGFDWLVRDLVQPLGVPFTLLLIAFELTIALLVLSKGRRARLGLLAAVAFMVGLAPFTSWYGLANVPLVAWGLLLLGRDDDRSLLDMLRPGR